MCEPESAAPTIDGLTLLPMLSLGHCLKFAPELTGRIGGIPATLPFASKKLHLRGVFWVN